MRINHNIAALNTNRQLSINSTNTNKALEKLSSGLRINKAGDDAAGLAISEKMRAQIRGLDQANRNAQDGISMIQTAEGALNETHSILQRMRELANQSANDTNVDVDRVEIQKEINQLTSEINRIGNTTEFNTQKLLNGGTVKAALTTNTAGVAVTQGEAAVTINTNSEIETQVGGVTAAQTTESVAAEAEVLGKTSINITTALVAGKNMTIAGVAVTFASGGNVDTDTAITAEQQATALAAYINGQTAAGQVGENWSAAVDTSDLSKIILTQRAGEGSDVAATAVVGGGAGAGAITVAEDLEGAAAITAVQGEYTLTIDTALVAGECVTVGGQVFTFGAGSDYDIDTTTNDTAAEQATALAAKINANATLGARFENGVVVGNVITLTETVGEEAGTVLTATESPVQIAGDYDLEITKMFEDGEQITFGGQTFTAVASGANAANGQFAVGTSLDSQAESLKAAVEAKLGTRFTVTLEDNKLNLVEKTAQATGVDLAITSVGNVEGAINFKQVDETDKGTAAVWNTGAVSALGDNNSGSFTFNGVTVNITSAAGAVAASSDAATKTVSITIVNGATSAAQTATAILSALSDYKTNGGDELADFTFAGDETGITITDKTDTDTGIATNGDNHNALVIGATGDVVIASTTNATQLTTIGEDSVKAEYTFDITNAFKANETLEIGGMVFKGVAGEANALLGEFSVDGNKAAQAESLKAAIEANTALSNRYGVTIDDAKITLTEKVAGQETVALTAPTTELTKATAGVYSFNAQSVNAGQVYNIDGVEINVVDDAEKYKDDIATGKAMMVADNVNDQAENLRRAINANADLSEKYAATGSGKSIVLTQQEGFESATEPNVSIGKQGADGKFVANFQIGANTGQSMTIEVEDMRAVALNVSGSDAGTIITAKNGAEASFVSVANVSNGTDNASVEFSLDVSDHTKATAAVSVIQDAIETVSAQRSQLGAYQNRLEHTINNLGTSSENMSDAESRIRDVDMAKEMTEFTKNNILAQAAQSMLAQANQQPEQILQLLR